MCWGLQAHICWELRGPLGEGGHVPQAPSLFLPLTPAPRRLKHTQKEYSQECSPDAQAHWAGALAPNPLQHVPVKPGDPGLLGLSSSDWHVGGPSSLVKELQALASLTLTSPPGLQAAPPPLGLDSAAVPAVPVPSLQLVPSPAALGTLTQPPAPQGIQNPGHIKHLL